MANGRGRLPDFLIIGAAKSGTSTLFDYLCKHPRVFGCEEKEPCFFDPDVAWDRGLDWYRSLFAGAREDQLCVEASTNYTRYPQVPGVPERIRRTVPDAKLIYLMRHPIDRAFSHYVHRYTKEVYPGQPIRMSFERYVERDPLCLDSSDFTLQIEQYLEHFPSDQILLLRFDELRRDPASLLERVQRFLDLEPEDLLTEGSVHTNDAKGFLETRVRARLTQPLKRVPGVQRVADVLGEDFKDRAYEVLLRTPWGTHVQSSFEPEPMKPETRRALADRFAPSIDRLEELMGRDLSDWRD